MRLRRDYKPGSGRMSKPATPPSLPLARIETTMGNAALRGPAVEERLTQPRRLVRQLSDLDSDRLRRLIRSGDLAPCFDASDEDARAVECPICFHFYPSLNRSNCCGKGICTECFLQLMPSKASRAVQKNRTFMRLRPEYIPRTPVDIFYDHRSCKPSFAV
ncbi:protein SIP5-like [Hordeum vulgare]|nr:protein SIP5-like [Hordeum vulgare]